MPRFFSTYCLLLFLNLPAEAQFNNSFLIAQYSTENGLPSNGIKGLELDEKTGFLWIGTEAGVVRFNGIDFKIFSRGNLPEFSSERILFLIRNYRGDIFFSDQNDHLFKINSNTPVLTDIEYSDPGAYNDRHFSKTVTNPGLAAKIRHPSDTNTAAAFAKSIPIGDTAALLMRTNNRLCYISVGETKNLSVPGIPVKDIFKIKNHFFIVTVENSFFLLEASTGKTSPVSFINKATVLQDANLSRTKFIWETGMEYPLLFTGKDAWRLSFTENTLSPQLICNVVPENSFIRHAQYNSKNGLLCIGTESKGLIIIRPKIVFPVKNQDIAITEKNSYYSQVLLNNGNILTNQGHIIGMNKRDPAILPVKGIFNSTVYTQGDSLLYYSQSALGSQKNIFHAFHYKTGQTTLFPKIEIMESFAAAHSGNRLFIALEEGMGYLESDSLHFIFHKPPEKRHGSSPTDMQETAPGVFLVASCNGLIQYNTHNLSIDTLLHLPGICVRSINKIGEYCFIGTYGMGLFMYKNGVIKKLPLDKNNFLLYTHCVVPDTEGFCWLSTNRGLFKTKLSDLVNAYEHSTPQIYYHYLGKNDGMDITEMNGGCTPCALRLKNNVISFPTMDGLLWVDPSTAKPLLPEGNIYIDAVTVDNNSLAPGLFTIKNSIPHFSATTRLIKVNIAYAAWCNKENILLDYRLNEDEPWRPINTNNEAMIQLENLSAGKYNLEIRKLNGFGNNNYTYKTLPFIINAAWYSQWWFYSLAVIALLGLIRLYTYYRTRQLKIKQARLEKQVAEKTLVLQQQNEALEKNIQINRRLISIISHDIITPLKFVAVGGKELMTKKELMTNDQQLETIADITNTAQELQLLSTNIMNWIKYQNENRRQEKELINVHQLVNRVISILQSIAKEKSIIILNEVAPQQLVFQYMEPMKILLYNLITNAINFSVKSHITVGCDANPEGITLFVKDEGIGMTQEQIKNLLSDNIIISSANIDNRKGNGLGYLIIKELLKMVGGILSIQSKKEEGTIVSIFIPIVEKKMVK